MILNKIMHIEDDPSIQQVAKIALEMVGGFTVQTCSNGYEAIQQFTHFKPDLILLDVMMPGMDGPTTLLQLQQQFDISHTPVIFMTAKVQSNEVAHYKALGAADVVIKPFDPIMLSGQLQKIWQDFHSKGN